MQGPSPEALDRVAVEAMKRVAPGMKLGLGTGRAAEAFIARLAEAARGGMPVEGVTTSNRSQALADELGLVTRSLADIARLDIAFDGADEVTPGLDLTKGLGGALLRERVVAHCADAFVVLVTPEKCVPKLASRTHIPIEVVPFAEPVVRRELERLAGSPRVREAGGARYLTDNGNLILDTGFAPMDDPRAIDRAIRAIPGVVDTGLFLGMATTVLVGHDDRVEVRAR